MLTFEELEALGPMIRAEDAAEMLGMQFWSIVKPIRKGLIIGARTGEKRGDVKYWANLADVKRYGGSRMQRAAVARANRRKLERMMLAENEEPRAVVAAREAREALKAQLDQATMQLDAYMTTEKMRCGLYGTFGEFCQRHGNARIRLSGLGGSVSDTLTEARKLAYWSGWITEIRERPLRPCGAPPPEGEARICGSGEQGGVGSDSYIVRLSWDKGELRTIAAERMGAA